jgi:anti-anti-sigma factor
MSLIKTSQAQGRVPVTIFHIQDRINLGNATELEKIAKETFATGVRDLILDLTEMPSITSAGIRSVVVIYKMFSTDDGKKHVKLAGAAANIREILDIAGISQSIELYDSLEEAVASF